MILIHNSQAPPEISFQFSWCTAKNQTNLEPFSLLLLISKYLGYVFSSRSYQPGPSKAHTLEMAPPHFRAALKAFCFSESKESFLLFSYLQFPKNPENKNKSCLTVNNNKENAVISQELWERLSPMSWSSFLVVYTRESSVLSDTEQESGVCDTEISTPSIRVQTGILLLQEDRPDTCFTTSAFTQFKCQ